MRYVSRQGLQGEMLPSYHPFSARAPQGAACCLLSPSCATTTCYYLLPYYYLRVPLLTDRFRVLPPLIPGQHHSAPPDDLPTLPGYHPILGAARLRDVACVRARYLVITPS